MSQNIKRKLIIKTDDSVYFLNHCYHQCIVVGSHSLKVFNELPKNDNCTTGLGFSYTEENHLDVYKRALIYYKQTCEINNLDFIYSDYYESIFSS